MCYTSSISAKAFCIGIISSLVCIFLNHTEKEKKAGIDSDFKILGYFFIFVSFMQLFDWIFWTQPDNINKITTKIACIFNNLQPIVLALLIYYFKQNLLQKDKTTIFLVILFTICITLYTINGWSELTLTKVTKESSPSLYWQWNNFKYCSFVYLFFLFMLCWLIYNYLNSPYNYVGVIITISFFLFSMYKYKGQLSTGRFWCYFAAFVPIIFVILLYLKRMA